MNIAIEAFSLSLDRVTGIGNVVLNYISELQRLDRDNRYFVYTTDTLNHARLDNPNWRHVMYDGTVKRAAYSIRDSLIAIRELHSQSPGAGKLVRIIFLRLAKMALELANLIWFPLWMARSLRKNRIDVYFGNFADYFPPVFLSRLKALWLIHDLVWKIYPETLQKHGPLDNWFIRRNMKRADLLMAVSDNTKKDMRELLGIRKEIITLHNAADRGVFYQADAKSVARVKKKFGITKQYILSVCTLEPRKNLATLLDAYGLMKSRDRYHLVLVGMSGWKNTGLFSLIEGHAAKDNIIITGYIDREDLAPLYTGAALFVYPSLYEGFGLPLLEAMQCGCPVISSTASSLPEVVGDAGILVEPMDLKGLAASMERLLAAKTQRAALGKKGLARARIFSWEQSALRLLEIFRGNLP